MTNRIELTPVAVTDLSLKYARKLENNRIVHYTVPVMEFSDDIMSYKHETT